MKLCFQQCNLNKEVDFPVFTLNSMDNFEFSEFILYMEKLPVVRVSEGGVRWLTDAKRLFVQFLKDNQVEYLALKAQFQQKWPGTKPPTRQAVLKCGRNSSLSTLSRN